MSDELFSDGDSRESGTMQTLGPHYFSSRRIVREFISKFDEDAMKPLIDEAVSKFRDKLLSDVQEYLWDDVESNLQSQMWRTIDQIMQGVLSGEKWIMDRYALGGRYDCEKARAAIAKHIGDDVAKARIADLEAEVSKLKKDLEWFRSR